MKNISNFQRLESLKMCNNLCSFLDQNGHSMTLLQQFWLKKVFLLVYFFLSISIIVVKSKWDINYCLALFSKYCPRIILQQKKKWIFFLHSITDCGNASYQWCSYRFQEWTWTETIGYVETYSRLQNQSPYVFNT